MADKIKLLPEVVANQIAAGEVVEKPASVVKEMMENAIDAGAHCVKVLFRNGGAEVIQIIDDGCGMSPFDARMAFDRHTTSKIASVDDIYRLHTFGFRGEALASISAVSQIVLRTRQKEDDLGTENIVSGGEFISQKPVATPAGSNFSVKNLFFNVPARRKFMSEPSRMAAEIKTEFQRVALCYPQIAFELYSGDNCIYNLREASLATRITEVIGGSIKKNLLEVNADTSIVKIDGYVGRPAVAKKRNTEQYLFVNGRYFKSPYLSKAVLKAYEKLIPDNSFPSYFIYITVDPERIDVNVSPRKTEVKFADLENIWQILNAAVRETLAKTGAVPLLDFDNESDIVIPISQRGVVYKEPSSAVDENYNPFLISDDDNAPSPAPHGIQPTAAPRRERAVDASYGLKPNGEFAMPDAQPYAESFDEFVSGSGSAFAADAVQDVISFDAAGQQASFDNVTYIGGGYATALLANRLVIADLRRARERILYEHYLTMLGNNAAVTQQLLFSEHLMLSNDEYALLEENAAEFAALGFDMAFNGEGSIEVKGIPAQTREENVDELIFELLKVFETPVTAAELHRERIAAAMARSGASRSPRNMTSDEAAELLGCLAQSENIIFTPSGKAILSEMTIDEIRNRLG